MKEAIRMLVTDTCSPHNKHKSIYNNQMEEKQ
jgi:hypothetical protein